MTVFHSLVLKICFITYCAFSVKIIGKNYLQFTFCNGEIIHTVMYSHLFQWLMSKIAVVCTYIKETLYIL